MNLANLKTTWPDRMIALAMLPIVLPLLALLYVVAVPLQGRPFLYRTERMRGMGAPFLLLKIRTMHPAGTPDVLPLGGDGRARVTRIGAFLRSSRLDEVPQVFNLLKGDMRLIGPRPPLRRYVEAYPELYARVLGGTLPGVTGLATVMLYRREERLLSACRTAEETDAVYMRRCIPVKARLDLIARRRAGWRLSAFILWRTIVRPASAPPPGKRGAAKRSRPRRVVGEAAFP